MKTHFETIMSASLKNLIGCLVGLDNKQKVHYSLCKNILHLVEKIQPDLQIVDALIAMEGLGPSKGNPIKTNLILIGEDPFLVDLTCASLAGFDYREVRPLRMAEDIGLLSSEHIQYVDGLDISRYIKRFKKPKVNPLVRFVNYQKWQKYFIKLRLSPGISTIFNSRLAGKILSFSGLRQDVFVMEDDETLGLNLVSEKCDGCRICSEYCPMGLDLPNDVNNVVKGCIHCLYCYLVCPQKAIAFEGNLGFLKAQMRNYDESIRKAVDYRS
jgi:ferredoxin